jgi:type II secretory pathway pseudopilin PulG
VIARLRARLRSDEGFTLVELIVVFVLGVLVLSTVGGIYISTIGVQQLVGGLTRTTTDGQLAGTSIDSGVRNGSEFAITTLPSGDQLLRVRTLDGTTAGVWHCRAWYFESAGDGAIRTKTVADGTVIAAPTGSELASWTLLVEGIHPSTGSGIFTVDAAYETVLAVDFSTVGDDEANATRIKFSTPLMPESTEEGSCF